MATNTYVEDIAFLKEHTKVVELTGSSSSRIAVTPGWQGRVMTSTLGGTKGSSLGWVNESFIRSRQEASFNNYGGEDRFWLGPEAGQFGLFFDAGAPFDLAHTRTPEGFNSRPFEVTSQGRKSVAMTSLFDVANYSGVRFNCAVRRAISIIDTDQATLNLGATVGAGLKMVAFESRNTLANVGEAAWTAQSGLLSIWILGQFRALPQGKVIVPLVPGDGASLGAKATTNYFGELSADRCSVREDYVSFKCDGLYRSKIGISPMRAKPVLGSYDPQAGVLTIVQFNLPGGAARLPYVNSMWEIQKQPYAGDAINSYNDSGDGKAGSFYELETSSPGAVLAPGGSITHVHRTYHFAGPAQALGELATKALGVDLAEL